MSRILTPVVMAALAAMLPAGAALGGETERASYEFGLTAETPSTSSGMNVHVVFKHPDDPEAKPPALDGAELELPTGMRIDDGALPRCEATDEDFEREGRDACPEETQVGAGAVTVMTGVPGFDPQTLDIVAFNGNGEIVEVVFFPDTNVVAGIDRLTIEDGRLVAHPPSPPGGPPDGRTAIRELRLEIPPRRGPEGNPYITTPPECPDAAWASRGHFEFADGGTTVVPSETPCRTEATVLPALAVSVKPKRTRVGKSTKFEIEATSTDPRCVDAARVRLGKKHRTRTDEHGKAELEATFARRGARRLKVSKDGCQPARTRIRVRRQR